MLYSVDRVEQGTAVLVGDDGTRLELPEDSFDFEVCEAMLLWRDAAGVFFARRADKRRNSVQRMLTELKKRGEKTDDER